jgi:hypothetical protein
VDASYVPGNGGGGVFSRATDDGSAVFFTDQSRLTSDSTAAAGKPDLYRFDTESGQLADLTVDAGEAADVLGVGGIAENGSYVYFAANGTLAPGAQPGNCPGTAQAPGHCSLYVVHGGSIELIGTISGADSLLADASPNGRFYAFKSSASLTGYDNTDTVESTPNSEVFLYRATAGGGSGELRCVSCPSGPSHDPAVSLATVGNFGPRGPRGPVNSSWKLNAVLDDGSVFFGTRDSLLPADSNESADVYEYGDGGLHLISPGDSPVDALFLDASPDGTDVFFLTAQSLVGGDAAGASIYDARVDGGFPKPPPDPPPCDGEACRPPIQPPPAPAEPGSPGVEAKPRPRCLRPHHPKRCHEHGAGHKHRHRPPKHRRPGQ